MFNRYKNQKRSPLKKESLSQAGQSLNEKMYDVFIDKVLAPLAITLFVFYMAIVEWIRVFFNVPNSPWPYTIISIIVGIYCLIKVRHSLNDIKNLRLGRDGERLVGEALEELRMAGYRVYHDILSESFNIDHIIIGPAGVFTIETKTYRKRGKNPQIYYDGVKIEVNGVSSLKDPVKQAKGQMYWLEGFINDNAKIKVKVRPVVVFPGWFINQRDSNAEVWVLNEKALCVFLKNAEKSLNQEQINSIANHLENYIRNN